MSSSQVAVDFVHPSNKETIEKTEAIDETISDDVMLNIAAFVPYSIRGVNKRLTKIDEKRERIEMIKIYKEYKDDGWNHDTVIIHPKRTHLSQLEKEYGFWTIGSSIKNASKIASRILIHSGVHSSNGISAWRGIRIIGIGEVIIKRNFKIRALGDPHFGFAEILNITFDDHVILESGSATFKNCSFTVKDWCVIHFNNKILNNETLTLQNCKFTVMMTEEALNRLRSIGHIIGPSGIHWGMGNGSTKSNKLVVNDCDFGDLDYCVKIGYYGRNSNKAVQMVDKYGQFANNQYSKHCIVVQDPYVDSGWLNYTPCENQAQLE